MLPRYGLFIDSRPIELYECQTHTSDDSAITGLDDSFRKSSVMLVKAIEVSANRKLGPVSTTSVSQISCPEGCPWYDDGKVGSPCYANNGFLGFHTAKLNRGIGSHIDAANEEANAIRSLSAMRPLRLHVVGDCKDETSARIVSRSADDYRARYGQKVWSYTHAWRDVSRSAWGGVSVLASCDTPSEVRQASSRGYSTALVVDRFVRTKAYVRDGVKIVPCPQETGRTRFCTDCQLCFKDDLLRRANITIGFEAHSGGATKMRKRLVVLSAKPVNLSGYKPKS